MTAPEPQAPVAPRGTALRTQRELLSPSGSHLGAVNTAFLQPFHRRELGASLWARWTWYSCLRRRQHAVNRRMVVMAQQRA